MKFICVSLGFLLSLQVAAAETFRVSTWIKQDGNVVANPIIQVTANKPATISIADVLELEVMVQPEQADSAVVATKLKIGEQQMQPRFSAKYGKKVIISQGAQQLELQVDPIVAE